MLTKSFSAFPKRAVHNTLTLLSPTPVLSRYFRSLSSVFMTGKSENGNVIAGELMQPHFPLHGYPVVASQSCPAWKVISHQGAALDAVVAGCSECEQQQCDGTVGYGGSPDEHGETTLDALIMDGVTHDVGAVGGLRRVKNAIAVARAVMDYTKHTLLVGELATEFAKSMGFKEEDLHTNRSVELWKQWTKNHCQPNYRKNVIPDALHHCGPYHKKEKESRESRRKSVRYNAEISRDNHDTIGMLVADHAGNMAGGTSSNGANHKVPGRVGDAPIMGAGLYVDNDVGGAAATGDGDVMMRFLPTFFIVEKMRQGVSPTNASRLAIQQISRFYPKFSGALIALTTKGNYGAACHGFSGTFHYSVRTSDMADVTVMKVPCSGH